MNFKKMKRSPLRVPAGHSPGSRQPQKKSFDQLQASLLHCPKCGRAVQVRERLLLILPDGQLFEYRCVYCGNSIGERTEKTIKPAKIII